MRTPATMFGLVSLLAGPMACASSTDGAFEESSSAVSAATEGLLGSYTAAPRWKSFERLELTRSDGRLRFRADVDTAVVCMSAPCPAIVVHLEGSFTVEARSLTLKVTDDSPMAREFSGRYDYVKIGHTLTLRKPNLEAQVLEKEGHTPSCLTANVECDRLLVTCADPADRDKAVSFYTSGVSGPITYATYTDAGGRVFSEMRECRTDAPAPGTADGVTTTSCHDGSWADSYSVELTEGGLAGVGTARLFITEHVVSDVPATKLPAVREQIGAYACVYPDSPRYFP